MLKGNRVSAIRTRARRGWSVHRLVERFGISRNTVRRYLRQGQAEPSPTGPADTVEFELRLVRRIARRLLPDDPGELESELTLHLATLLPRRRAVKKWMGFLFNALWRKGLSRLKQRKKQSERIISIDSPVTNDDPTGVTLLDKMASSNPPLELIQELRAVRCRLTRFDRDVLDALISERFNITSAARRLGVHPNTIYNAVRRVRAEFTRRGWTGFDAS